MEGGQQKPLHQSGFITHCSPTSQNVADLEFTVLFSKRIKSKNQISSKLDLPR